MEQANIDTRAEPPPMLTLVMPNGYPLGMAVDYANAKGMDPDMPARIRAVGATLAVGETAVVESRRCFEVGTATGSPVAVYRVRRDA